MSKLFVLSPHVELGLAGVEIIFNSSGDRLIHHKFYEVVDLAETATAKGGGCYVYTNCKGGGGTKLISKLTHVQLYMHSCTLYRINK